VDATTDRPIGMTVLTTHSLLQQQRDSMIEQGGMSFASIFRPPVAFTQKQRLVLELRIGLKSDNFFAPSKLQSATEKSRPGKRDIMHMVSVKLMLLTPLRRCYWFD
jgi:hypothetical protein